MLRKLTCVFLTLGQVEEENRIASDSACRAVLASVYASTIRPKLQALTDSAGSASGSGAGSAYEDMNVSLLCTLAILCLLT